jgi:hypothetical protein
VTVRHATKGHVTLPFNGCQIRYGFKEILNKNRHHQYGEYGSELSRLEDILWPPDRPLPYPAWGAVKTRLHIASLKQFNELIKALTILVQNQLKSHCYNTVGNFLT